MHADSGQMRPRPGSARAGLSLIGAYDAWMADQRARGRLRHDSSQAVYSAMWQALVAWCLVQTPAVALRALDAATLARYVASREGMARHTSHHAEPLHPRYQWRLLSLVQRVQAHHTMRHQLAPNTAAADLIAAQPAVRRANASLVEQLPAHLAPGEARQLVALLASAQRRGALPEGQAAAADAGDNADGELGRWQDLRNRVAVALQLGAGLGPGEVRALSLADVQWLSSRQPPLPWRLSVPASGSAPAHEVPVQGWAAQALAHWLARRAQERIGGQWLFPSTRSGKPWGKVAQFEAARRVLAEAGISGGGGGSFRLRHTFALRQLKRGRSPDEVARWLGITDPAVMARYQRVLTPRHAEVA